MVNISSTFITLLLIYGIVKNRPSYIMPYFSIKVFELVITSLSALSSYSCVANLKEWYAEHKNFPLSDTVAGMNMQQIELLTFAFSLIVILIKLYIVIIVWYCYRYMVTVEAFHNLQLLGPSSSPTANVYAFGIGSIDAAHGSNKYENDAFLVQPPPKYDDVFSSSSPSQKVNPSSSSTAENVATTSSNSATIEIDSVSTTQPPAYTLVAGEQTANNKKDDENIV